MVALVVRAQIVQKLCMLPSGRFPGNPGLFVSGLCLRVHFLLHSPQLEYSVARSLQTFTATPRKNNGHLGTFHGHQIFCITATFTAIFLASFPTTFIAFPHRSCCCWRFCCWGCALSCWCPLLKAGIPVAGTLAVANIPAVACFHAVAGVFLSAWLTATNFPRTSNL